jgi:hypothetical protein
MSNAPHITQLRQHLLDTLVDLRNREQPMEPDRARAVAQVASVLVDTAKAEIDYLRVTGQQQASFLEEPTDPAVAHLGRTPTGVVDRRVTGVTRHRLAG